jgi:molecular chaperone DnaK (HSP70)
MNNPLGLSIGTTNLVVALAGSPPVRRRAVLTLFAHRVPEVGVPADNPNLTELGVVMSGYVERIGDPVPLVAPDGSRYPAVTLLAEALEAMVRAVGAPTASATATIAVPAHWDPAALAILRDELRGRPTLASGDVAAPLISDAVAALTALSADPGLPARGVVALLDFGGSGTSITLADAAADFAPVGKTLRYTEFSGDLVDQALLDQVLEDIARTGDLDPAGTAAVGSLSRLREGCRQAKEQLSSETTTDIIAELPGYQTDIRFTRAELEDLIRAPLDGVLTALDELLAQNHIAGASLAAVATVGGGAAIPLVAQRLAEHLQVPLATTPYPAMCTAVGAALVAARGPDPDAATAIVAASEPEPTAGMALPATGEWEAAGDDSSTFRALAWSQDDNAVAEPVPYTGEDYSYSAGANARPPVQYMAATTPVADQSVRWYRRPALVVAAVAVLPLIAVGGLAYTLTSKDSSIGPAPAANSPASKAPHPSPAPPSAPPAAPPPPPGPSPSPT